MYYRELSSDIKVALSIPQHSRALFEVIDENRDFLQQWVPWVNGIESAADVEREIAVQLQKLGRSEGLHETVFYQNEVAGVVSFQYIDRENETGYVGYWLGEKFTGKGIMTLAVADLIRLGFEYFSLQKIDIRCTEANEKSCAIPLRLGFKKEGTARRGQKLHGRYFDQAVFGLLRDEFLYP